MDEFMRKHGEVIEGVLSCFDRMLFRGYLPIMSGAAMAEFLQAKGVDRWGLKTFLLTQAARLKKHAMEMAAAAGRPYQYLGERTRKEDLARQIAERDGIGDGLVCVFALLELSRTFSVVWKERNSYVQSTRRKCLQLYYYFMDRELGLIHVKLQTWFPFQMQIYLNGHEWLARKLDRRGVKYLKVDNAFAGLSDVVRAQQISDQFPSVDWVRVLGRYARRINPLLGELLRPMEYYWVTAQAEYSTDILFSKRTDLQDLMPRLLEYSTLYFGAKEVMSFLGRKLVGQYRGEVVTDQGENGLPGKRVPGCRVKHRAKSNWIKMYDKGSALRVETVINQPERMHQFASRGVEVDGVGRCGETRRAGRRRWLPKLGLAGFLTEGWCGSRKNCGEDTDIAVHWFPPTLAPHARRGVGSGRGAEAIRKSFLPIDAIL